jgi:hypothetical protein
MLSIDKEDSTMPRGTPEPPETVIADFLRKHRRKRILRSFLGLSFLAAVVNETYRWSAALLSGLLPGVLPITNVGHFFLLTVFVISLRKWSLPLIASQADRRLGFRERLTSFMDFSGRNDVPAEFRKAQARETAKALGDAIPRDSRWAPFYLYLGPLLLLTSIGYPMLALTPLTTLTLRQPGIQVQDRKGPTGGSGDGASFQSSLEESHTEEGIDEERAISADEAEVTVDEPEVSQDDNVAPVGNEASLEMEARKSDEEPPGEGGDEASDPPSRSFGPGDVAEKAGSGIDPIYSESQTRREERRREVKGSMTYRLIPEGQGGGEGAMEGVEGKGQRAGVVVDYELIPPRYRRVVEDYFMGLASRLYPEGES